MSVTMLSSERLDHLTNSLLLTRRKIRENRRDIRAEEARNQTSIVCCLTQNIYALAHFYVVAAPVYEATVGEGVDWMATFIVRPALARVTGAVNQAANSAFRSEREQKLRDDLKFNIWLCGRISEAIREEMYRLIAEDISARAARDAEAVRANS